jgi:hypothetical protein
LLKYGTGNIHPSLVKIIRPLWKDRLHGKSTPSDSEAQGAQGAQEPQDDSIVEYPPDESSRLADSAAEAELNVGAFQEFNEGQDESNIQDNAPEELNAGQGETRHANEEGEASEEGASKPPADTQETPVEGRIFQLDPLTLATINTSSKTDRIRNAMRQNKPKFPK